MAEDKIIYQTLQDYLYTTFGVADTEGEKRLEPMYKVSKNFIKFIEYAELENSYYLHLSIPSDSDPQKHYDVVIQFFPANDVIHKKDFLNNYFVNFFSNSPSFVYRYAVLYKIHGYMIDALQEKLDPNYADKLPEKSNASMKMSFDKSLYFACRFLYDNRLIYLSKSTLKLQKKVGFRQLVDNIQFNKDVLTKSGYEIEQDALKEQRKDEAQAAKSTKAEDLTKGIKPETNVKSYKKKLRPLSKKIPVRSTMKEERTTMIKPKGKKPKKISGRSTFR